MYYLFTAVLAIALCVYIYRCKGLKVLALCSLIILPLYFVAILLSIIANGLYWIGITTLSTGFIIFALGKPQIHLQPFVVAPLFSCFVCIVVDSAILGYLEPFWVIAILPLLLITIGINIFWGMFIFFLRQKNNESNGKGAG